MLPAIRHAQVRDVNYLADIDLKSYEYPWPIEKWRTLAADPTCIILIASFKAEPISVCAWQKKPAVDEAEILRLATKPTFRNMGIGTLMLRTTEAEARDNDLHELVIIVPEINCFPGHPDDLSCWLVARDFHAVTPILKDQFYMYGKSCDGFKFTHTVGANDD